MAVRSVESGAPAEEADQAARGAHDKLLALARIAQVTGDPAGPVLEALAAQVDAERRLFDDLKRSLAEVRQPPAVFTDQQIDDIGRRLLAGCQAWSADLVKAAMWRSWAGLAATVLVAVGLGIGVGWSYRGPTQIVAGITGGTPKCDDQADGSRLCWIPVFERVRPTPTTEAAVTTQPPTRKP